MRLGHNIITTLRLWLSNRWHMTARDAVTALGPRIDTREGASGYQTAMLMSPGRLHASSGWFWLVFIFSRSDVDCLSEVDSGC